MSLLSLTSPFHCNKCMIHSQVPNIILQCICHVLYIYHGVRVPQPLLYSWVSNAFCGIHELSWIECLPGYRIVKDTLLSNPGNPYPSFKTSHKLATIPGSHLGCCYQD